MVNASGDTRAPQAGEPLTLLDLAIPLFENKALLTLGPLLVGLIALGVTYLIPPTFAARTTFVPPQQQQSVAATTLASLGALAGLATGGAGIKSPADQYVALMESTTATDRVIDKYELIKVYDVEYRADARRMLRKKVVITVGKKDGLVSVEVEDKDPARAAAIANEHVEELRRLTSQLALTEAQQRRVFFENQLSLARDRLTDAQQALQASGFNAGALKAEPKAAAEGYARLKAEATAAEVKLQTLRRSLAEDTPEVQQQLATLSALRTQLARAERASDAEGGPDYVSRYREFKYQETLFDLLARQYELARVDESREGALIQVVDVAAPPEKRVRPKRTLTAVVALVLSFAALAGFVIVRHMWREARQDPAMASKVARLRAAVGLR